jgi:hypothetical protein
VGVGGTLGQAGIVHVVLSSSPAPRAPSIPPVRASPAGRLHSASPPVGGRCCIPGRRWRTGNTGRPGLNEIGSAWASGAGSWGCGDKFQGIAPSFRGLFFHGYEAEHIPAERRYAQRGFFPVGHAAGALVGYTLQGAASVLVAFTSSWWSRYAPPGAARPCREGQHPG